MTTSIGSSSSIASPSFKVSPTMTSSSPSPGKRSIWEYWSQSPPLPPPLKLLVAQQSNMCDRLKLLHWHLFETGIGHHLFAVPRIVLRHPPFLSLLFELKTHIFGEQEYHLHQPSLLLRKQCQESHNHLRCQQPLLLLQFLPLTVLDCPQ